MPSEDPLPLREFSLVPQTEDQWGQTEAPRDGWVPLSTEACLWRSWCCAPTLQMRTTRPRGRTDLD